MSASQDQTFLVRCIDSFRVQGDQGKTAFAILGIRDVKVKLVFEFVKGLLYMQSSRFDSRNCGIELGMIHMNFLSRVQTRRQTAPS
jgi:hypothetical protein